MLKRSEPMSKHCSFRAGGVAKFFFAPDTLSELCAFLQHNTLPILMTGLGSNLLVRDAGFEGVVIQLGQLKQLCVSGNLVTAQAGVTLAKLHRFCRHNQLADTEFLSTIPGSVGGALMMNAGAFGREIWTLIKTVQTMDKNGAIHQRTPLDFRVGYRQVVAHFADEYFVGAVFKLDVVIDDSAEIGADLLARRNLSQPIGQASCGSVFKNPAGEYAAELIERAQLKGFCIGGACVSTKHANFIINQNEASATDIENLIRHIQRIVRLQFGVCLETEVSIV